MIPIIKNYYSKVIDAPYPIAICENKELENENKFAFICHFNMTPAEKSVYGSSEREIGFFVEVLKDRDEYKINDFYTGL